MQQRLKGWPVRAIAPATLALVGSVSTLPGQVPSRIPSDPEAQIFSLIQRVTALEEKLAALTSGSASLRVRAPFQVVDAGGNPILQVIEGQGASKADPSGIVIGDAPNLGAALLAYNHAGQQVAGLAAADQGGALLLNDDQGTTRARLGGTGKLVISDKEGNDLLSVAEDISKEEANIRIGGDEDGYVVEIGSGKGSASLGTDSDGVAELSITDGQDRTRALLDGEGSLELSGESGRSILKVAQDVSGEDAGVAIGGGKDGGIVRVTDAGGKPAAGILGAKRAVVVASSSGKVLAEILATDAGNGLFQVWADGKLPIALLGRAPGAGGGILQVSNGSVPVASVMASEGGNGQWQLNDASGTPIVEAGALGSGRGTVRVGPSFTCMPMTMNLRVPDCMVGRTE